MIDPLPIGWVRAPLGMLGEWSGGGTPSKAQPDYWHNGTVPWVSPKDMKQIVLDASQDHITDLACAESSARLMPPGSIAFVVRSGILNHTLPIALVPFEAAYNQDMRVLTPCSELNARWLLWALVGASEDIRRSCRKDGVTVASIDSQGLQAFELAIPPRSEQDRIVTKIEAILSDCEAGTKDLAKADDGLDLLRVSILAAAITGRLAPQLSSEETAPELRDRVLRDRRTAWETQQVAAMSAKGRRPRDDRWKARYKEPMSPVPESHDFPLPLGWTWATVDELAVLVQYGTSTKTNDDASGVPIIRMGNLVEGDLVLDTLKYLPPDHDEFPDLHLHNGDVLFNRTNSPELVGKAAVFRGQLTPCSYASYLIRVRLHADIRPEFLVYFLTSPYGRQWIRSVVSQQVGQANVNGTKLRALTVPLPPAEEQRRICDAVEVWLRRADELGTGLAATEFQASVLRRSVLRSAAAGGLVPRESVGESAAELLAKLQSERVSRKARVRKLRAVPSEGYS